MGFNDREIVALCGAHAIGRCHTDASGYWGPWNFSETAFSNEYFRLLLEEKWTIKRTHEGKEWKGPAQFEDKTGKMMMLPSDMVIIQDPEFRKYAEMYTKDEALFFKDFSAAFSKLLELGVVFPWGATRV
jgi:cytochrome c peroxidase